MAKLEWMMERIGKVIHDGKFVGRIIHDYPRDEKGHATSRAPEDMQWYTETQPCEGFRSIDEAADHVIAKYEETKNAVTG